MGVSWSLEGGIYELVLGREPCNEIGTAMLDGLERFLAEVDPARGAAVVVHSSVRGGFCAGADLRELHAGILARPAEEHEPALRAFIDRIHRVMDTLDALPLVTIAVVHGVCFGGGFELALACDLRVAERTARFCFPELRLGIVPGFGGIPRLRRDVGNAVVRDLLFTGRSINAKKAVEIGLCAQMVATGDGLPAARAMAAQATKFDPEALRTCKAFMKPIPREELEAEKEHFIRLALRPPLLAALDKFVSSTDLRPYLP